MWITPDIIKRYRQFQVRLMDLEIERNTGINVKAVPRVGAAVVDVYKLMFGV